MTGARLVDEDRIHLVDDRVVQIPLDLLVEREGHIVAQIIETELVVRTVGDIGRIGRTPFLGREPVDDHADRKPEKAVDPAHPLGVTPREVVVDGNDMDAAPGQGIEVHRQGRDQRLALAGLHLGDAAVVEHHGAHQLNVEGTQPEGAFARLLHDREGLGQQIVERLAVTETFTEPLGLAGEFRVIHRGDAFGLAMDIADLATQLLEDTVVAGTKDLAGE